VFLEHSHRLFGALVGLTTLTLTAYTLAVETRRRVKWWAVTCALLVCVQGYLGGQRVIQISPYLGALHGVVAQLFFAMMVALAAYLSPLYRAIEQRPPQAGDRRQKAFSTALLHTTIVQLIFGALYRHVGQLKGSMHALWAHAGFSLVVLITAIMTAFALRSRAGTDRLSVFLRQLGTGILVVVSLQFILGWVTFVLVLTSGPRGPAPQAGELETAKAIDLTTAIVATIHQGNGALLLALATLATVFTRQVLRARAAQAPAPAG
jgi:cytochrome c oxidase assembly protein subunit 15